MEAKTIRLGDGRKLAWAEYGQADGVPVFFFHGTPGSHLLPDNIVALVERIGLRLIVPDRPGFGLSDFQPERTLLDWPDDVLALADALGIERFGVVGFSGGGLFAAACAYKTPTRLTRVALVSSLAPFEFLDVKPEPKSREQREAEATALAHRVETEPDKWIDELIATVPEAERALLADSLAAYRSWLMASFSESFRQGVQGLVHEGELIADHPWGFALKDITADVYLWHGEADTTVLVAHGRYLAEHIPNCNATFLPNVTHLVPTEYLDSIYGIFVDADASR